MIDGKAVVSYVDFNAPVSLNGLPTKEVHEALRRAGGGTMTDILKNIGYDVVGVVNGELTIYINSFF